MPDSLQFEITLYPQPVLRKVAEAVEAFDEELGATVEAMYERMVASNGVGLAAPQVGIKQRILVLNPAGERGEGDLTLINPEILELSGPKAFHEEGCLSFPGIYADVERPEKCKVRAQDVKGETFEMDFDGFLSRIIQHEYDHLEGVLLVDRMSPADKVRHKAALKELVDDFKEAREAARQARNPTPAPRRGASRKQNSSRKK